MKKSNILYYSFVDWYWIKQRPQHFSELLSRNNCVTYLSISSWRKGKNIADKHSVSEKRLYNHKFYKNSNLLVIRKKLIPKSNLLSIIRRINQRFMKKYLKKLDLENNYDFVLITHPLQIDNIPDYFWKTKKIIYDCMDNYIEFPNSDKKKIQECEKKLIEKASLIITSSEELRKKLHDKYNLDNNLYVINNGVDIDIFDIKNINIENEINIFRNNKNRKVGYIGTVSEWVDLNLVYNCAQKNQDIDFYIIGPIDINLDISRWDSCENLIFTGSQPYYSIPNILKYIDVAIMPFKINDLINSVNPVKIYEYLAMGKLVLATKYKETTKFGNLIETYNNKEEFENTLLRLLETEHSLIDINKKIDFAKENSWGNRVDSFEQIIHRGFK